MLTPPLMSQVQVCERKFCISHPHHRYVNAPPLSPSLSIKDILLVLYHQSYSTVLIIAKLVLTLFWYKKPLPRACATLAWWKILLKWVWYYPCGLADRSSHTLTSFCLSKHYFSAEVCLLYFLTFFSLFLCSPTWFWSLNLAFRSTLWMH